MEYNDNDTLWIIIITITSSILHVGQYDMCAEQFILRIIIVTWNILKMALLIDTKPNYTWLPTYRFMNCNTTNIRIIKKQTNDISYNCIVP